MNRIFALLVSAALGLVGLPTLAQDQPSRKPISLPADVKAILLAQMLGHIVSLDEVITSLGQGNYAKAAEIANNQLGTPRFQYDEGDKGPGLGIAKHLPEEFRAISQRFRLAADNFADLASDLTAEPSAEQQQALFTALGKITTECKACHDSYRIE